MKRIKNICPGRPPYKMTDEQKKQRSEQVKKQWQERKKLNKK